MIGAIRIDPTNPGRKKLGQGETAFTLPAWHELNRIGAYVRRGDRVVDAYVKAGLQDILPHEGMWSCIHRAMLRIDSLSRAPLSDHALSASCAECWQGWINGPPTGWAVRIDRVELAIGITLPKPFYQRQIEAHVFQGVPLRRAYEYEAQEDIIPEALLTCMEAKMSGGANMAAAATGCHDEAQPPVVTPPGSPVIITPPVITPGVPAPGERPSVTNWLLLGVGVVAGAMIARRK